MIDTHTHLYSEQFNEDRTEMVRRAIAAGVERMYMPNIDLNSMDGMHAIGFHIIRETAGTTDP